MDQQFWYGAAAVAVPLLTTIMALYLRLRQQVRSEMVTDREYRTNQAEVQRIAEEKAEKTALRQYRQLYNELKDEYVQVKRSERRCDRRLARFEAALLAAGIPLPPLPEDESTEHIPLQDGK